METKNCQNCKKDFKIDSEDISFYEKMNVPIPTFCPLCRMQRRCMFRNERTLYKRTCDLCKNNIVSIFAPDKPYIVYCPRCWYSDGWDSGAQYLEYDPSKNFFEQLKELQLKTPFPALIVDYSTLINSEYVNHAGNAKDSYLFFNGDFAENVYYSTTVVHVRDLLDCLMMDKGELSYEAIDCSGSRIFFSENCLECVDVWYSKDCNGCTNCFGCVNLRNKSYYIYNQPYTREEYKAKIEEMMLDRYSTHQEIQKHIYEFWNKYPRRYMYGKMNTNSSGEYVYESKNAKDCYIAQFMEDTRYCQFITIPPCKDCADLTEWGMGAERCVDSITVGEGAYNILYCNAVWRDVRNVEYSMYTLGSKNCFGCVSLKKKEYCILNKQYSKEEYMLLREKIIENLKAHPYRDIKGREFGYGDYFPYDLSLFDYNESYVMQYFPLPEDQILENGWRYRKQERTEYEITIAPENISDSIQDIPDDFTKEILQCVECGKAYRIVAGELALMRRLGLPIHRKCSDCRHARRIERLNKPKLYERTCDKCSTGITTSYTPERPEIVYCESCYQQEVM